MGLFDKLFKANSNGNDSNLTKTAQLLDEDLFWKIIDDSLKNSEGQDEQEQYLISTLGK